MNDLIQYFVKSAIIRSLLCKLCKYHSDFYLVLIYVTQTLLILCTNQFYMYIYVLSIYIVNKQV